MCWLCVELGEDQLLEEPSEENSEQRSTSTALQEIFQTASGYAPGSQKHKAEGTVLRWHKEYGKEEIPVREYIESLEHEVNLLRREVCGNTQSCLRNMEYGFMDTCDSTTASTRTCKHGHLKCLAQWSPNAV